MNQEYLAAVATIHDGLLAVGRLKISWIEYTQDLLP